ncbi:MAG: hypothetical protein KDD69_13975 [Bdellovibrionales bacterium]|nr:hypothetical protein [Bdellovibrionales bacterium]
MKANNQVKQVTTKVLNTDALSGERLRCDEAGKGTVWAMLLCIAAITAYLKGGQIWLTAHLSPFHHILLLLTVGVITLFTVGCALHMVLVGDKSRRELRKDLKRQIDELYSFVAESQTRIQELETRTMRHAGVIRPRGINSLGAARRIVAAIRRRADEVNALLSTRNKYDLIDAHELLCQELDVTENAVDSLIGADPIPTLRPEEWLPTVSSLCEQVDAEIERVAA